MVEYKDMELTSPHENINTYLYAKQFSLKTDWKMAEGFLYSQGCKKDAHVIWAEREETEFKDIDGIKCVCVCVCIHTHRRLGFDPRVVKIPWRRKIPWRKWQPLQYPCLENTTDRGAEWATVHGAMESWTCLSN